MKIKYLILMTLGLNLLAYNINAQSSNDSSLYFLLDRNTKLISYRESPEIRKGIQGIFRRYDFKSEIKTDDPRHASLYHLSEVHPSVFHKTLTKPLSFLDSIRYYDEKWLTETEDLMYAYDLNKYILFVIDKTTIKNDSVTLYQVKFDFDGRE